MGMIAVYGEKDVPEKRLNCPVKLTGALVGNDSKEPTIYIKRTIKEKGIVS